ncbi:MAG: DUF4062 domain-containing protein [Planctomycetes bacterium]|nr:DUF4062 domain-containing protein [Planctomycetota bacterium]
MSEEQKAAQAHRQRLIRVFVSSTFRDMQEEREELVKHVFPQLRKLCEERGVTFVDVDLRWGVTNEQVAEGQVLPICLAEIENCRPFFIGLLGERYGWVPQHIPQELIKQHKWLEEHLEKSVTELEIIYGVLDNLEMANRACFYFRDPKYIESVPDDRKADFTAESAEGAEKLQELKERIRQSGLAVRENYPDPKTLGEWVLKDLTVAINQVYPPGPPPEPLDRDAAEHEAFAESRARVYIPRQKYFDLLDKHVQGDDPPLVVLGESGVGKSALLANWALRHRASHPDDFLLMHFIGASSYSADWAAMLRRIMGEFNRRFEMGQEIPDDPDELRMAFANSLHMASARGRVILILDGLNQLEDRDQAPDLVWLPAQIPPNVRLILSTLPGRALENLEKRGWPMFSVDRLGMDERRELIDEYLGQYRKALGRDAGGRERAERIASTEQSANPLYLRALLEELRVFGVHEQLDERIDYYLEARTIPDLYERILERYEEDYEGKRRGLVREAMALLWASRRGLLESELLEMLGGGGDPLPRAQWSPLHLAADQSLVTRCGLIGFFHDYLREAVQHKYLPTEEDQHKAHIQLADQHVQDSV